MKIFAAEHNDGLADIIRAQASLSIASLAQPSDQQLYQKTRDLKAIAALEDKDLYYVQSILVTSSWNKNDDIFDSEEVWTAKDTPSHKPTNLEHDENTIIGHIVANWPMTEDGILIDNNTPIDNIPHKFHILTASVIYTGYASEELRNRANKLITEIENGQKYVSMECFFKGFDYGLLNKTSGEYRVLSRREETAHLTKYLRAYGGMGEHENYKIGRVLRQITFSGKGFVDRPANPESVIFTHENMKKTPTLITASTQFTEKNTISTNEGVFSNQANLQENSTMSSDTEVTEQIMAEQTPEATTENTEATSPCDEMASQVASLQEQVTQLEAALASEKEIVAQAQTQQVETLENLKAELTAANEVIAGYKAKEEEMAKKEKKMKRVASLVESGVDADTADATVEKFESLDDEAFAAITALVAAKKAMKEEKTKEEEKNETEEEVSVDASVLENVEVEKEIGLSVGQDTATTEVENTRAALVDFVYNRLGKKLNKGE